MNYVTDLLAQGSLYNDNIFISNIPKMNVIFNFHHLLFQNLFLFLVNSSNLMDTIKTILVLIELQFNSTVNS